MAKSRHDVGKEFSHTTAVCLIPWHAVENRPTKWSSSSLKNVLEILKFVPPCLKWIALLKKKE